jgi:flagellar biosynthetic protein FlhB
VAEQSGADKSEAPTQRRLDQAAEEGRVARSAEFATAALFLGASAMLAMVAPGIGQFLTQLFGDSLARVGAASDVTNDLRFLSHAGWSTAVAVAALCALPALAAVAAGGAQANGTFTWSPLQPKWSRLNPLENAKQFGGWRPWVDLFKSVLKIVVVAAVAWAVLRRAWPDLLDLASRGPVSLLPGLHAHVTRLFLLAGLAFLAIAGLDYGWQRWQHLQGLRMTKEEVKQEAKQTDGDPLLKARMRSIARARVRRRMLSAVPTADVVIVNPTHRAVALRYDPLVAPAPLVVAMGERKVAERIKELARAHNVPMIENKPLAVALLASARVGMMIPAELYVAVAEVLAFVFRQRALQGQSPAWASGADA